MSNEIKLILIKYTTPEGYKYIFWTKMDDHFGQNRPIDQNRPKSSKIDIF